MSVFDTDEHRAIQRLFELVREGKADNGEFNQLNLLVYERLSETYPPEASITGPTVVMQAAA